MSEVVKNQINAGKDGKLATSSDEKLKRSARSQKVKAGSCQRTSFQRHLSVKAEFISRHFFIFKIANTADKYKTTNIIQVAAQSQQSLTTIQIDLRDAFVNILSKTFRAQFYQNPTKLLNIAINICLIKKLIKVLFTVHYLLLLSSFAFQTLLIRVITFQIDIKRTLWPVTS